MVKQIKQAKQTKSTLKQGRPQYSRGRFSVEAIQDIRDGKLSDVEIARKYNKTAEKVALKRAELQDKDVKLRDDDKVLHRLHTCYFWQTIKKTLFPKEIEFFNKEWLSLHNQFADQGIMHTDEIMMKDLILHEIMANRAAAQKKKDLSEIEKIQRQILDEIKKPESRRNDMLISTLELRKNELKASIANVTKEYLEYQKKKDEKLQQLKATRQQRLKQTESAAKNIWSLIKEINKPDVRRALGKYMEKTRIAADQVREQWKMSYKYEDGQYDQPLICADKEDKK